MHKENSTKQRQYVLWQGGGMNWQEAGLRAKKEIKKEWKKKAAPYRRDDGVDRACSQAPRRELERREPDS
jgi:hypothetical protein